MSSKNVAENLSKCFIRNGSLHSSEQSWDIVASSDSAVKIGVNSPCSDLSDPLNVNSTIGYDSSSQIRRTVACYPYSRQPANPAIAPWQILRLQKVSTPTPTANVSWISEPLLPRDDDKTAISENSFHQQRSASTGCSDLFENRRNGFPDKTITNFPITNDSKTPQHLWYSRLPRTSDLSSEQQPTQLVSGVVHSPPVAQVLPISAVAYAPNKYVGSGNRLLTVASTERSFDASRSGNLFASSVQPTFMWSPVVRGNVLLHATEVGSSSGQVDAFRNSHVREQGEVSPPNVTLQQNLSALSPGSLHPPHHPVVSGACSTDLNPGNSSGGLTPFGDGSQAASSEGELSTKSGIVLVANSADSRKSHHPQVDSNDCAQSSGAPLLPNVAPPSSISVNQTRLGRKRQASGRKQKSANSTQAQDRTIDTADAEAVAGCENASDQDSPCNVQPLADDVERGGEHGSSCSRNDRSRNQGRSPLSGSSGWAAISDIDKGTSLSNSDACGQDNGSPPRLKVDENLPEKGKSDTESHSSSADESSFMSSVNYGPAEKMTGLTYSCHLCGFTNDSKFHFNSHMNTHADHKCDICDYRSRTEGRLKRHRVQFHEKSPSTDVETAIEDQASDALQLVPDNRLSSVKVENPELEDQLQQCMLSTSFQSGSASPEGSQREKCFASGARNKTYRCKQCFFIAQSKNEFWIHQRSHIKTDKQLACPKCPFVTEYKHHLEYHLRNHFNSKPFKCSKCNYSCVNKSMLNSHMKSHSNFYQYRCADCTYATKYCHSLKLHLRKYGHNAATVMNPDGSTIDASAIDVYGNRRGPRGKKGSFSNSSSSTPPTLNPVAAAAVSEQPVATQYSIPLHPLVKAMQQQQSSLFGDSKSDLDVAAAAVGLAHLSSGGGQLPTMISYPSMLSSLPQKCTWCDYVAPSQDLLLKHVVVHFNDNKDMLRLFAYINGGGGGYVDSGDGAGPLIGGDISSFNTSSSDGGEPRGSGNGGLGSGGSNDGGNVRNYSMAISDEGESELTMRHLMLTSTPSCYPGNGGAKVSGEDVGPVLPVAVTTATVATTDWSSTSCTVRRSRKAITVDRIADRLQCRVSPTKTGADSSSTCGQALRVKHYHRDVVPLEWKSDAARRSESGANFSAFAPPALGKQKQDTQPPFQGQFDWSSAYVCNYCMIAFKDCVMYNIHMGYHAFNEPFKCNMCGHVCEDRLSMFIHIARDSHQ